MVKVTDDENVQDKESDSFLAQNLELEIIVPNSNEKTGQETTEQQLNNNGEIGLPTVEIVKKSFWTKFSGIILTIVSCIFLSLGALIVKYLTEYNKLSLASWRFMGVALPSMIIVTNTRWCQNEPIFDNVLPIKGRGNEKRILFLFLRAIVGSTGLLCLFSSLKYLDLADTTVIASGSPVFVQIIAAIFLKEKCDSVSLLTAFVTFAGIIIISRPPILTGHSEFNMDVLIGSILAFGNTIFTTLTVITLRYLKDVHYAVVTSFFGIWGCFQALGASYLIFGLFDVPSGLKDIVLVTTMALMTFIAQSSLTLALQTDNAGFISIIRSSEVIFAFLWQFIFLDVIPDLYSILGALIVILCLILTAFRKWLDSLPEKDSKRNKLSCLLLRG